MCDCVWVCKLCVCVYENLFVDGPSQSTSLLCTHKVALLTTCRFQEGNTSFS